MTEAGLVDSACLQNPGLSYPPDEHSIKSSHSLSEEPWRGLFDPLLPDQLGIALFGVPDLKNELDFFLSQVIKSVSPWLTYLFFVIPRVVEGPSLSLRW